jgi:hypothetical protein
MEVQSVASTIPLLDGEFYKGLFPNQQPEAGSLDSCFPWTLATPFGRFDILPGGGTGPISGALQTAIPSQFTHYAVVFGYWTTDKTRIGLGGVFLQGSSAHQQNIAPNYIIGEGAYFSPLRFAMFPIERPGNLILTFQPMTSVGVLLTTMPATDELHAQVYVVGSVSS